MKFRIFVAALLLATVACSACASGTLRTTRASLFSAMESKNIHRVMMSAAGQAYYLETIDSERLYIATINGEYPNDPQVLYELFRGKTDVKTPDLMITACSDRFGDEDCDFYSPLHQPAHTGSQITKQERSNYYKILEVIRNSLDQ